MTKLLTGSILEAKKTKVYNHWPNCSPPNCQTGCRYHQQFYKLKVKLESNPIKNISAFTDKLTNSEKVLKVLATSKFIDKRYLFTCVNHYNNWHLIDWQEIKNHD